MSPMQRGQLVIRLARFGGETGHGAAAVAAREGRRAVDLAGQEPRGRAG